MVRVLRGNGQRATRDHFHSSELRERGFGRVGASEPRKGPRANLEGDSYRHPARKRSMHLPLFPHQIYDVGARGAKELGGLCPGINSRDEAKRARTHTSFLTFVTHPHPHAYTPSHATRHTNMHNTQAGLLFRYTGAPTVSGETGYFACAGTLPPPFPGFSACFMYKVCWVFLFLLLLFSYSGNVLFPL